MARDGWDTLLVYDLNKHEANRISLPQKPFLLSAQLVSGQYYWQSGASLLGLSESLSEIIQLGKFPSLDPGIDWFNLNTQQVPPRIYIGSKYLSCWAEGKDVFVYDLHTGAREVELPSPPNCQLIHVAEGDKSSLYYFADKTKRVFVYQNDGHLLNSVECPVFAEPYSYCITADLSRSTLYIVPRSVEKRTRIPVWAWNWSASCAKEIILSDEWLSCSDDNEREKKE